MPACGARPMLQAAKWAGAAAIGGGRGQPGCPTTTRTLLPRRRTHGDCLMATLRRAEFADSIAVSGQAAVVGCGAGAMALVAAVVPLQQAPLTVLLVRRCLGSTPCGEVPVGVPDGGLSR
jgi:hypothetical protein